MHTCCSPLDPQTPALLLIDVQKGFSSPTWGLRNQPDFEKNLQKLIQEWRKNRRQIIHVQHLSTQPESPLYPGGEGTEFMDFALPFPPEPVFTKSVNSAFIGTELEQFLKENHVHNLVIAGLTTDHCVSTTTRMASNLGFKVYVVEDATATFNRKGSRGEIYPAELVHELALASLRDEFAEIVTIAEAIRL